MATDERPPINYHEGWLEKKANKARWYAVLSLRCRSVHSQLSLDNSLAHSICFF
jgi:hypothetical protein